MWFCPAARQYPEYHTACSDRRNNSASSYTDYYSGRATAALAAAAGHPRGNSLPAPVYPVPFPYP